MADERDDKTREEEEKRRKASEAERHGDSVRQAKGDHEQREGNKIETKPSR